MNNRLTKIDNTKEKSFQVTWDVGRRCNYDCTYCPSHRHDNFSSHASYEKLIQTYDFVRKYFELINSHTIIDQRLNLSLTGGEPTNNPNLLNLLEYMRSFDNKKKSSQRISITTNGTFNSNYCDKLTEMNISVILSYHCEADQKIKNKIIERIYQLNEREYNKPSVNLMFHANENYFKECVDLANRFVEDGIKFSPRIIGEGNDVFPYAHTYTKEQHKIIKDFWKQKNQMIKNNDTSTLQKINYTGAKDKDTSHEKKLTVANLGRPCCGGRTFCTKNIDNQENKVTFLENTEFQGWKCLVNWHWLHIEQQTDEIFHHQTCQATFNKNRGSIGTIKEANQILEKLEKQFSTGTMPVVVCSKKVCGCGMCLSKAKSDSDIKDLFSKTVKSLKPLIGEKLY